MTRFESNIKILMLRAFLDSFYMRIHRVIYQPFVLTLNPSMSVLGILESVGGYQGIIAGVIRPVSGWISDRTNRKSFIILGSGLMALSLLLYLLSGLTSTFLLVIPALLLSALASLSMPIIDSLVAESVTSFDRRKAYNTIMLASVIPGIIAPLIGGFLADSFSFVGVFYLGIVVQIIILVIVIWFLKEQSIAATSLALHEVRSFISRTFSPSPHLRNFYRMSALDSINVGLGPAIMNGLFTSAFAFTTFQLGILAVVTAISTALVQTITPHVIERWGCKITLILSYLTWLVWIGGVAMSHEFTFILLFHIPAGMAIALWVPTIRFVLANSVKRSERAEAMGRVSFYRGFIGFPAPFVGGLLFENYGYSAPLWTCFGLSLVAMYYIYAHVQVQDSRLVT
jgi:MFS family permease